jgi:hypothetical protein
VRRQRHRRREQGRPLTLFREFWHSHSPLPR